MEASSNKQAQQRLWTTFYLGANLIGIVLYLLFVSAICNTAKMEERDYYDFGDSLNYILTALPVYLLCLLLNVLWGLKALKEILQRRDFHSAVACVVAVALWVTAKLIVRHIM